MVLNSADSYLKQAVKQLSELKSVNEKLRDTCHYSNDYLDKLSRTIITNNLLISKIKKLENPVTIKSNMKKYNSILPIFEIVN